MKVLYAKLEALSAFHVFLASVQAVNNAKNEWKDGKMADALASG